MSPLRIAVFAGRLLLALLLGASVHAADAAPARPCSSCPRPSASTSRNSAVTSTCSKTAKASCRSSRWPQSSFAPGSLKAANVGFTSSVWWARVTFRNADPREREIFLRQTYPLIDYLDVS